MAVAGDLTASSWKVFSDLLDRGLELPVEQRAAWLDALEAEHEALKPALRAVLERSGGAETAQWLDTLPHTASAAPADDSELHTDALVGPYRLLREIGVGGMGAVWLAERADGSLKRKVALKLPRASWSRGLAERMARERDILASLEHPNIARLYDAGTDVQGRPFLALEYVEGEPIDVYCRQRALTIKARLQLLLQVAQAVAFAHSRLVVHRDLKPSNILVTADGHVRLLDFGIAKLMEGDRAAETQLTQLAGRALTLDYASPEQIRGEPLGTASDVYSLGVVSYELLAGAKPYRLKRQTAAQLEEAIAAIDAPLASAVASDPGVRGELKGDLDAILNKALKKNTNERYATVDALAQDWRRHLEGHRVSARPDTLTYRAGRFVSRHRLPLAGAGAAVCALAIGIGVGAAALVAVVLAVGLAASLLQTRRATRQRDRALALAQRNAAVNEFLDTLLTRAARAGPLTAEQLLRRSEELIEREISSNAAHRAYVLGVLASCYQSLGDPARAAPLLARASQIASGGDDRELIDSLVSRHASARGVLGEVKEAMGTVEAIVQRSKSPEVLCEAHHILSVLASRVGDQVATLEHADAALRWFRTARTLPPRLEASLLGNLAWALHIRGESERADHYYAECLSIYRRLGLEDSPQSLNWMQDYAHALQEMGDVAGSIALFDQAVELAARAGPDAPIPVYAHSNRAYALAQMGRYAEADSAYRRVAEAGRAQGGAVLVYNVRMCVVELYADQGRGGDAERELRAAEAERSFEAPEGSAAAFARDLARARVQLLAGQPEDAVRTFTAALDFEPGTFAGAGGTTMLLARAGAYLVLGRLDAAEEDASAAESVARRLQGRRPASFRTGLALLMRARIRAARGEGVAAAGLACEALAHLAPTLAPTHLAFADATRLISAGASAPA